jgi:rhodanese-related sulfurtransferase
MCRSGKRSAAAIMQLEAQGYTNLSNLQGRYVSLESRNRPRNKRVLIWAKR